MVTHRERILAYLQAHPRGADDDLLARELGIAPRQSVNQTCRQLASSGVLVRRHDPTAGKILNILASAAASTTTRQPTSYPAASFQNSRLVTLDGQEALQQFVYTGEIGLTEDQVKQAVGVVLRREGWKDVTRWGRERGIDIEARRGAERMVLEAKGEGSLQAMRVNYFLCALGELLQRMDSSETRYGLALPAHRQFVGLVVRLPAWVKGRLNLCFYLVRPAPDGYEVGLIVPGNEAAPSPPRQADATQGTPSECEAPR
jgi:hypothetical protein